MSFENVITILNRGSGRGSNGTIKRFGRTEYISRRKFGGCAPYPMWLSPFTLNESSSTKTIDFPWGPDETWWLRDDDIIIVAVRNTAGYSITSGYTKISVGSIDIWWKRWKTGDALSVDVSLTSPSGISNFKGFVSCIRQCIETGSPFDATAYSAGTGTTVNFPSVSTTASNDLVFLSAWHEGTGGSQWYDPAGANDELDDLNIYLNIQGREGVFTANKAKPGATKVTPIQTTNSSAAWKAVTLSLKPKKTPTTALAGPVNGYQLYGTPNPTPIWLENDLVVAYRISTDVGFTGPAGWERMAGTPVLQGTKYLHVFWNRWTPDEGTFYTSWPDELDWAYHVFRNAARSGDPFESITFTTGNGTSVTGGSASANGKLVAFAAILDNIDGKTNQLGIVSASGVTNLEVDSDPTIFRSDPNRRYQFFKTASAIGSGSVSFSVPILRSARDWWTVTYAVKKR